ncbi:MAG: hypothetical protein J6386_13685 [Candidatus Synoicihabitans palmerolidicus]|nr:hypothetical protein [Candidatus Synoicihabitans palmerolidicus]
MDGFARAYERALAAFARQELFESVPLVYTWGALDYGTPADNNAINAAGAHLAYRQLTPHYPLPADSAEALQDAPVGQHPINQVFSVGRVRFLLLDTRTARDSSDTDAPASPLVTRRLANGMASSVSSNSLPKPMPSRLLSRPFLGSTIRNPPTTAGITSAMTVKV